jgi:hypothetical protein
VKEWLIYIKNKEERINFAFTALCFSTLALSIQFSRGEQDFYKFLLIMSWILLLFSSILGGIRLFYSPIFDYISYLRSEQEVKIEQDKVNLKKPEFVRMINSGTIFDPSTMKNYSSVCEIDSPGHARGSYGYNFRRSWPEAHSPTA